MITNQRCIIIPMGCNISLILVYIGRTTAKLIYIIDYEYDLSGRIVEERRISLRHNICGDIYYIRLRGKTREYDALRDQSLPSRVS